MNEILTSIITQWGIVGVLVVAAAYIIYDNYKTNKEREKIFKEKIAGQITSVSIKDDIAKLSGKIDLIEQKSDKFNETFSQRLSKIELDIKNNHPDATTEAAKFRAITNIAPAIHSVLGTALKECDADHIFVALLHNGTQSICGTPFFKFDIVAEKYYPIHNPEDEELALKYRNADVTIHEKLPSVLMQNEYVRFDINQDNCPLEQLDTALYKRMKSKNISTIVLACFRDARGLPNGFIGGYTFDDKFDEKTFMHHVHDLETLYQNILK